MDSIFLIIIIWIIFLTIYIHNDSFNTYKDYKNYKDHEDYDNVTALTTTPLIDMKRIDNLEENVSDMKNKLSLLENITLKMYEDDINGDFIANGWFVSTHNVVDTPYGIELSTELKKFYAVKRICFKVKSGFPFLGLESDPTFIQRADKIGFRAMTVFKIPKTGTYTFSLLTDDGARLFYQKVNSRIMYNERNARSTWNYAINAWFPQSETQYKSEQLSFNENDLILLRLDWFDYAMYSTCCLKIIVDGVETDLPIKNLFCSLIWLDVPLIGIF